MESISESRDAHFGKRRLGDFKDFVEIVETAVRRHRRSHQKPYSQVAVLAFHWENDDMFVEPLEKELLEVFRDLYGFHVESFVIPVPLIEANPYISLIQHITSFISKWDAEGGLMIFIYSGHSERADKTGVEWNLGGNNGNGRITGPTIDWYRVNAVVSEAKCSVLLLMDCCFAATAAALDGPEVLAASGWESTTTSDISNSFTRIFVNELRERDGKSSTVAQIFSAIHRNAYRNRLRCSPIHIPKLGCESIVLEKLESQRPESFDAREEGTPPKSSKQRVLIAVNLENDLMSQDLEQWLTGAPSDLSSTDIAIEAAFDSSSSLILVTLSVEVWEMLPKNEDAYWLVGSVRSNNNLPRPFHLSRGLPHKGRTSC